ncbi:MAG: SDR family oxidoreductase [Anaerolineae bacterium]|nr:SDR family oxidoreductase [Anaerolineae bacterium]
MNQPERELENLVALVTGGTRGVGRVCALALADMGCKVAVAYAHDDNDARETVGLFQQRGAPGRAFKADVGAYDAARYLFDEIEASLGGVSVLVNNLGAHCWSEVAGQSFEEWHRVMDNTIHSTFYCSQRALPFMRRAGWGRIINIGIESSHRVEGVPTMGAVAAAKVAVASLTKTLALEEAGHGITVNMINLSFAPGKGTRPEDARAMAEVVPMKRVARPADVTHALQFLVSPRSEYITGNMINVTGGYGI